MLQLQSVAHVPGRQQPGQPQAVIGRTDAPSAPQTAMNMTMTIQTNHRPSIKRTQLQLAATATVKSVRRILFSLCFVTVLSPSLPVFEPAALFFTAN